MLQAILVIAALLGVAVLVARAGARVGLPAPAATVLVGIAGGAMLPASLHVALTPQTLGLFLPALIFEAAWDLDARPLRAAAVAIAVLALPGVLLTAALVAGAALPSGALGPSAALALGAILAATDPVSVLALFRALDVPAGLLAIVEGESIANDGVAVVLLAGIVAFASSGGASSPWPFALHGVLATVGGIGCGILVARLAIPALRRIRIPWLAIAVTLAVAYGAYACASALGASGIFASAAAGVALPSVALVPAESRRIERFWDRAAALANAVVFLLVGLNIAPARIVHEPTLIAATVASVLGSRALLAYGLVPLAGAGAPPSWRHAIALAGVRGGLSLALALGLPASFAGRPQIIDATFAVVFLTIVVQGWTIAPLVRRLRLT